jgi:hypothetical protein
MVARDGKFGVASMSLDLVQEKNAKEIEPLMKDETRELRPTTISAPSANTKLLPTKVDCCQPPQWIIPMKPWWNTAQQEQAAPSMCQDAYNMLLKA